jgi:hypothetical protein
MRLKLYQRYIFLCFFVAIFVWMILNLMVLFFDGAVKSGEPNYYEDDENTSEDTVDVGSDDEQEVTELGIVRNKKELIIRQDGYAKHAFNLLISKRLGMHRQLKDTRHKL